MTILQLVPNLEAGGVERGTLEVAAELVRRGHTSLVISGGGRLVEPLMNAGSEHITLPIGAKSPATLRLVGKLRQIIRDRRVDIVHARSRVPAWIGYWACRGTPARFVTTVHGLYTHPRYSAVMTRGERVMAVSETVRDYILRTYRTCSPEKIRVIHHGIDPAEFPRGYRPPSDWNSPAPGRRLITLPARITRWKGQTDFVELMTRLRDTQPDVVGALVGRTDARRNRFEAELRQTIAQRGLTNILFLGHRADMREMYAASRIVLSLSHDPEAFGRTTLEALSIGTPVIGYDHGGVAETLGALYPVGRVPVGDVTALTERVTAFLQAPPPVPPNDKFLLRDTLARTVAVYEELR